MILVIGATGMLGGAIARQLLESGNQVRILVRANSPSEQLAKMAMATSAGALIGAGAQPVQGDLRDRASLDEAMRGVDTVITTANSVLRGGDDNVESVDLNGNRNLVDAARAAGVEHFIFVSVLGADPNSPAPFVRAKAATEAHLRNSGMDFTILAPDMFMEIWPPLLVGTPLMQGRPVVLVRDGTRKHSMIASRDVAAFAVAASNNPAARNQCLPLGGPEALSWRDVVAIYERVLEKQIPVTWVYPGEPMPEVPEAVQGLAASMEFYDSILDTTELARIFKVRLTPLEDVVRAMSSAVPA